MASVTQRIAQITQPRGGYLKPSEFEKIQLNDGKELGEENVHAGVIGMTVDYLTRFISDRNANPDKPIEHSLGSAFEISIQGYLIRTQLVDKKELKQDEKNGVDIVQLMSKIKGLDDESIIAAVKATTYDVWFRNTPFAFTSKGAVDTNPDQTTINNIRILVERSLEFWKKYGPITVDGFTFENDGYTATVDSGDGDYLTKDTLWDFKVSKSNPTNKHTLQVLMYWIMGKHSKKKEFTNITKLGFFNPRLNTVYLYDTNNISSEVIKEIEDNVICY